MAVYWTYIVASRHRTLYTGITNDLERRVYEHKMGLTTGFAKKYNCSRLVFFESADTPLVAIAREKQIKGWSRAKKVALIESLNPGGVDLATGWFSGMSGQDPSLRSG